MERIFKKSPLEMYGAMRYILPEAAEGFEGKKKDRPDSDLYRALLLKNIFTYTKNKPDRLWKTSTMIDELTFIAKTKELHYLTAMKNTLDDDLKKYFFEEDSLDDIIFCGYTLWYYYRVYEQEWQSALYSELIENAFHHLVAVKEENKKQKKQAHNVKKSPAVEMKQFLDETIVGQENAKRVLAMTVHRFIQHNYRAPIMLCGPTGCGKTYLFEMLSKYEKLKDQLTFYSCTATDFTPNGFQGMEIMDILKNYKQQCHLRCGLDANYKGIIFMDEIDKLLSYRNTNSGGENVNETMLHQLLTIVSGTSQMAGVPTKDILFIFAGAFENIENQYADKKHRIGFAARDEEEEISCFSDYTLRKELIDLGVSRQFIARIGTMVEMKPLGREEIRMVFMDEEHGIFTLRQKMLEKDGIQLLIEDAAVEAMIDRMLDSNMGARAAASVLDSLITPYEYELYQNGYAGMIIHEGMFVGEPPVFQKVKGEDACENAEAVGF